MSSDSNTPEVRKFSDEIAHTLRLPSVRERVPGDRRRRFYDALRFAWARGDKLTNGELRGRLETVANRIEPRSKRQLHTCLILLDLHYITPANPIAQYEVYDIVARFYASCSEESYRRRIQDRLIEAQWSCIPSVRKLASSIRQFEPVTADEALRLLDDRCPPEIRQTVASRILRHHGEHFAVLLNYLISRTTNTEIRLQWGTEEYREIQAAGEMFQRLQDFPQEVTIEPLYTAYCRYHADRDVRGRLLQALKGYGDYAIVAATHVCNNQNFARTLRIQAFDLLAYMVLWGHERACDSYIKALDTLPGDLTDAYCQNLERHLTKMSSFDFDMRLFDRLEDFGRSLIGRQESRLRTLGETLVNLRRTRQIDETLLERLAQGKTIKVEETRIARSDSAVSFILSAITSDTRPPDERRRLLAFLGNRMKGIAKRREVVETLWGIFERDDDDVGIHALRALVRIIRTNFYDELIDNERIRRVLEARLKTADEGDKKTLFEAWKELIKKIPNPHVFTD